MSPHRSAPVIVRSFAAVLLLACTLAGAAARADASGTPSVTVTGASDASVSNCALNVSESADLPAWWGDHVPTFRLACTGSYTSTGDPSHLGVTELYFHLTDVYGMLYNIVVFPTWHGRAATQDINYLDGTSPSHMCPTASDPQTLALGEYGLANPASCSPFSGPMPGFSVISQSFTSTGFHFDAVITPQAVWYYAANTYQHNFNNVSGDNLRWPPYTGLEGYTSPLPCDTALYSGSSPYNTSPRSYPCWGGAASFKPPAPLWPYTTAGGKLYQVTFGFGDSTQSGWNGTQSAGLWTTHGGEGTTGTDTGTAPVPPDPSGGAPSGTGTCAVTKVELTDESLNKVEQLVSAEQFKFDASHTYHYSVYWDSHLGTPNNIDVKVTHTSGSNNTDETVEEWNSGVPTVSPYVTPSWQPPNTDSYNTFVIATDGNGDVVGPSPGDPPTNCSVPVTTQQPPGTGPTPWAQCVGNTSFGLDPGTWLPALGTFIKCAFVWAFVPSISLTTRLQLMWDQAQHTAMGPALAAIANLVQGAYAFVGSASDAPCSQPVQIGTDAHPMTANFGSCAQSWTDVSYPASQVLFGVLGVSGAVLTLMRTLSAVAPTEEEGGSES